MAQNAGLKHHERGLMSSAPVVLATPARSVVDAAIRKTCSAKNWWLHALNVRTNHVHLVVTTDGRPETALTAFKAWSTRALADAGLITRGAGLWTRHGSTRYLWSEHDVSEACTYVLEAQGEDITPRPNRGQAGR